MTQLAKILIIVSYGVSILFLPWWVSVVLAVLLLGVWQAYVSVILGAVTLDVLFGSQLAAFSGFSYVYTAIFCILALCTFVLSRAMLE
ncbi:hypothetical protein K2X83_00335 [Patescibacteria group bacterium]|nr:hypothetical protein [Patescibacteria group bacterium]